ncbi:MAG: hypothetical protein KTR23_17065 [Rhodospirillales bacterium]|nr:hypothetical protein [Rhodospirillales bacterium]
MSVAILDECGCPDLLTQAKYIANYISRHGYVLIVANDPTKTTERHTAYEALLDQIAKAEKAGMNEELEKDIRSAYQAITEFTFPERNVNGLTVWESAQTRVSVQESDENSFVGSVPPSFRFVFRAHNTPLLVGGVLLLAVFTVIAFVESATSSVLNSIHQYLIPMAWGAIGTTAYVLKRTTDARNNESYSRLRLAGYGTRIFLGAMFGLLIVQAFGSDIMNPVDPAVGLTDAEKSKLPFATTTAVVAFTAGLGIKPVYAAFEQMAIQISNRITGKKTESS